MIGFQVILLFQPVVLHCVCQNGKHVWKNFFFLNYVITKTHWGGEIFYFSCHFFLPLG